MNRIKILGIGSPFGDDQIGWRIVELLKKRKQIQHYISDYLSLECHDRPGIRLLELMENANIVYLIDAVIAGNKIGTIYRYENEEIEELKSILSTHGIGIAQTLQLGKALDQLPSRLILYGIEINSVDINYNISLMIEPAIHELVERIEHEILCILKI